MGLQVGSKAPDMSLDAVNADGSFGSYKIHEPGKWTVLFFYPLDFTFVCPTEINAFSDKVDEFTKIGARVLGCSIDSKFSHLAWSQKSRKEGGIAGLSYPLLADVNKSLADAFGVLLPAGIALRGVFIIDDEGTVQYGAVNNNSVGRSVDETLRVLKAFQQNKKTGEVCPANWHEGDMTMKPDPKKSLEYFEKAAK